MKDDGGQLDRIIGNRQSTDILMLFLMVQFGCILLAYISFPPSSLVQIASLQGQQEVSSGGASFLGYIALSFVVIALLFVLVFKSYKGNLLFKALETLAILVGSFEFFFLIIFSFVSSYYLFWLAVAALLSVGMVKVKNMYRASKNAVAMISSIGYGTLTGALFAISFPPGFIVVYLFFAIAAVYDYIAVFVTKHMIALGREAQKLDLALMVGSTDVEMMPESSFKKREIKEIKKRIAESKMRNPKMFDMVKKGNVPIVSQIYLGTGDLAFPSMLAVAAYITFDSIFLAVAIALGAGLGIIATMELLKKYKVGLPALPPLFAFINLALFIVFLLPGFFDMIRAFIFLAVFAIAVIVLPLTLKRSAAQNMERGKSQ